jgi:hypothetical protein
MQVSNSEVITATKQNNERTFEQVFREYYEKLSCYAYSFLKDMDEAEEMDSTEYFLLLLGEARASGNYDFSQILLLQNGV